MTLLGLMTLGRAALPGWFDNYQRWLDDYVAKVRLKHCRNCMEQCMWEAGSTRIAGPERSSEVGRFRRQNRDLFLDAKLTFDLLVVRLPRLVRHFGVSPTLHLVAPSQGYADRA